MLEGSCHFINILDALSILINIDPFVAKWTVRNALVIPHSEGGFSTGLAVGSIVQAMMADAQAFITFPLCSVIHVVTDLTVTMEEIGVSQRCSSQVEVWVGAAFCAVFQIRPVAIITPCIAVITG